MGTSFEGGNISFLELPWVDLFLIATSSGVMHLFHHRLLLDWKL